MSDSSSALTSERVGEIFADCLFREGEDTTDHIRAEGLQTDVGFHPERIEEHRQTIHDLLAQLPANFKKSSGGGASFTGLCLDDRGTLWTSLHRVMEQLVLLGVAIGEVEYPLPRETWSALPAGVPIVAINQ